MNAVVEHKTTTVSAEGQTRMTPMDMVFHVVQSGQPIEVVREMMALSREIKQEQAKEAFNAAIASAKAGIKPVAHNRKGHNNKTYADFSAYARAIDPVINEHGLSYRFRTEQTDRISVTCIISHKDGHSEENTLSGPADKSGSKNDIQAIGSTLTYLQRYTLTQALGLASSDDDDAASSDDATSAITAEQVAQIRDKIEAVDADIVKLCARFQVGSLKDMTPAKFNDAMASLERYAAQKRQREKEGNANA